MFVCDLQPGEYLQVGPAVLVGPAPGSSDPAKGGQVAVSAPPTVPIRKVGGDEAQARLKINRRQAEQARARAAKHPKGGTS